MIILVFNKYLNESELLSCFTILRFPLATLQNGTHDKTCHSSSVDVLQEIVTCLKLEHTRLDMKQKFLNLS